MQKLIHAAEINFACFSKGNDKGVIDIIHLFHNFGWLQHTLSENGRFYRACLARLYSGLFSCFRGKAFVVFEFKGFKERMFRIIAHEAAIGL